MSSGSRVVSRERTDGQTDRQTDGRTDMSKLIVVFPNFENAPNKILNEKASYNFMCD